MKWFQEYTEELNAKNHNKFFNRYRQHIDDFDWEEQHNLIVGYTQGQLSTF